MIVEKSPKNDGEIKQLQNNGKIDEYKKFIPHR